MENKCTCLENEKRHPELPECESCQEDNIDRMEKRINSREQKLEKITEAIHKACPDLLEVKLGCRVFVPGSPKIGTNDSIRILGHRHDNHWILLYEGAKILGQPIGIAEVLRTIRETPEVKKIQDSLRSGFQNSSFKSSMHPLYWEKNILSQWNLTKTLDQQEEPVISLLYSILCL